MKKFFAIIAMCAFAFVACNNEPNGGKPVKSEVAILSNTVVAFNMDGGEGAIEYSITNRVNGVELTATSSAEWVDVTGVDSVVSFAVESNDTGVTRSAKIDLIYGDALASVSVIQTGTGCDVEFTAKRFEGNYYGTQYSSAYNYFVVVSDAGLKGGNNKANGSYYYFDFYSNVAPTGDNHVLPNGTYTLDLNNTYAAGTIADESSYYCMMDANGGYDKVAYYSLVTVTVTDGCFDAEITMIDGTVHHVVYEGELLAAPSNVLTTLIKDASFNDSTAEITVTNYGDIYGIGKNNIYVAIKCSLRNGVNDFFGFDLLSDAGATLAGVYEVLVDDNQQGRVFIPGTLDEENMMSGSWYYTMKDGKFNNQTYAPFVGGSVEFVHSNGNNYTVVLNLVDDGRNVITGELSGIVTEEAPM